MHQPVLRQARSSYCFFFLLFVFVFVFFCVNMINVFCLHMLSDHYNWWLRNQEGDASGNFIRWRLD